MTTTPAGRPRTSTTHERAVVEQDNGELQEDVVATDALDADDPAHRRERRADEESEESFPASDPPSHWADAGGAEDTGRGDARGRVVERGPVEHVPERRRPDDPVPRTLPR